MMGKEPDSKRLYPSRQLVGWVVPSESEQKAKLVHEIVSAVEGLPLKQCQGILEYAQGLKDLVNLKEELPEGRVLLQDEIPPGARPTWTSSYIDGDGWTLRAGRSSMPRWFFLGASRPQVRHIRDLLHWATAPPSEVAAAEEGLEGQVRSSTDRYPQEKASQAAATADDALAKYR
jgi:hypothetical protein